MPDYEPSSRRVASVVTPGNYDGVHVGHRRLLTVARDHARELSGRTVALFFEPHPMAVLNPTQAPLKLTSRDRRVELLERTGADRVRVERFDEAFAAKPARSFASDILAAELGARAVVVGPDFRFGQNREGDIEALRVFGMELGFDVHVVDKIMHDGEPISSTRIRRALAEGDVELAAKMLARVHDVDGVVILGQQRGRTIGFPTANLAASDVQLPRDGVYAVVIKSLPGGAIHHGVANLGVRPTFAAGRSLEVHIFDFAGDLYGAEVRVGFVARIRDERQFEGIDALRAQIGIDVTRARECLATMEAELLSCL